MIEKKSDDRLIYSDGIEIEAEIQNIAKTYTEEEIPAIIANDSRYLINNTFSPVRKNLLDWYPFKKDCDILEVGAGMGSLTGLLCEKAQHVTSVEMSDARAQVIRDRNKGRKNLTIWCGDILSYESASKYDYIVMVGVLEYAAIFSDSKTPFTDFLAKLKSLLKPEGVLLFAIENQFGLKYWLGASEEHLQKPFKGIQGYPDPKTAKTFSKAALEQMCQQMGWGTRFYYLAPDYKFPTAIFTDESLPTYHDLRSPKYAYSINSCLTANERELYRDIVQNNVFPFFANAYLIEASASLPAYHIIRVHGRSEVLPEQRILTAIDNQGQVFKIPQTGEAVQHIEKTFHNENALKARGVCCISSAYDGHRLKSDFCMEPLANEVYCRALEQGDLDTLWAMIDAMERALRSSSDLVSGTECHEALKALGGANDEEVLLHGYMDMTFYNAFWINGKLMFFDQEWDFKGLPLRFILYYGLKICYEQTLSKPMIPFSVICDRIGVTPETALRYDRLEAELWSHNFLRQGDIYGADGYYNQFGVKTFEQLADTEDKYHQTLEQKEQLQSENECLQSKNNDLQSENDDLQKALSNAQGECQQLRDKENQLKNEVNALRNSRSYRLGNIFARIVRFFIPRGSRRALCCRLAYTMVRHPIVFMRKLSMRRVKKFFRLLKSGESEYAGAMMQNVIGNGAASLLPMTVPDIIPVDMKEKQFEDYPVLHIPQWEAPQVSIIIPVYNQFEFTYRCVESILRNTGSVTYEILIANDCSTDLTTRIEEILPGVRCITNPENLRFLRNCNNAAKHAIGQYVLFLNNDTQVQPDWLMPLVSLIESAGDIGMVGSKLIYPDGKLQEAGGILWKDGSAWNYGNGQNPAQPEFNYVKQVDYISGAAIMLSRALWEEIGGFDEHFAPAYCEDSDLAFTVRKMGYRVMYQPLSVVVHFEGVSNGTDTSSGQKKYQIDNTEKFYKKWKKELEKHPDNASNVFQARDCSFHKKTLLMVDHYVPQFDKDAGSRTVFQYLKLFTNAGFNVKFIGDNFYRHEPYTTLLQQMGVEVLYGPYYAQNWKMWVKQHAQHIDYVFLNRPHIAPTYLDFLRENTNARIVYYGHDLAFLREMREYEITGDASLKKSAEDWQPKELDLMRRADMAYYPSYVEVDEIHSIDPSIRVKAIPAYLFEDVSWEGYDFDNRKDIMFIGGFSHRPNIDAVKWIAEEILPKLLQYLPDVKIHILGSNAPKEVQALASDHLIMEGFVTDEQLESFYRNCRISLVPLRYGAGIKGKVIEAMRYGAPVVTTSTGAEGIANAEQVMLIEDDGATLAKQIAELYVDRERLLHMSRNGITYIQNNYSSANAIRVIGTEFDL